MRIYYGSKNIKLSPLAVALGDFDAIHKGHLAIISDTVSYAKEKGILSAVYMFASNPNKDGKSVNTLSKRLEILEKSGIDVCVVEEFTKEFKETDCKTFAKEYIENRLNAKGVFVGFNYRFGKGASGDAETLKELCEGTQIFVKPCVMEGNIQVSSTVVKESIEKGEVDTAKAFMGRYFSIRGVVVKGKQIGRTIGFPTANIEYPKGIVIPKEGVYITQTKIGDNKYYSITNVGEKPTVSDRTPNIETAVGDFNKDIYGEEIEIEFCRYIREIQKFDSLLSLKEQIEKDMEMAKEFFGKGDRK